MRIRRRLTLYGVVVTGLTMLAFGVALIALSRGSVPTDQDNTLAMLADSLLAETPVLDPEELVPGLPLPTELDSSTAPFVTIYDATGAALYTTGFISGGAPPLPAAVVVEALGRGQSIVTLQLAESLEIRLHARSWPTVAGGRAVLAVGQSTAFIEEQIRGLTAVIFVAAILAMLASVLVSYLVSGRALRPLRQLAATTDEIGRTGDLSRRLPTVTTRDEVGALTASFNSMLDSVEDANARLADALESQRRFVADASHELRSPLTTIRSNAGFLAERPDATADDRRDAVDDISAEADRMAQLVDDLLTLAVRDAGREMRIVPMHVEQIFRDLAPRADTLPQTVTWMPASRATIKGDRDALARLLWTLIDNAVKHGADEVTVSSVDHPNDVSIIVSDDGPGFPGDDLDRVFERFYRGDPARSPAGSGLGLSIAAAIVEAHGGCISAANRPQGGGVVTVTLPHS